MSDFPKDSDEFYRLRDDRTNRYVADRVYQTTRCVVSIDESFASTFTGQISLIATCNLLSRWCRNVFVVAPSVISHKSLETPTQLLRDIILEQMSDADPFGDFVVAEEVGDFSPEAQIHIGSNPRPLAPNQVSVSASGWYAAISRSSAITLNPDRDENCIGAIAAACFGVAETFKNAIGYSDDLRITDGIFNMFDLKRAEQQDQQGTDDWPTKPLDVGRVLMVGAGSVGSAASYVLRHLPVEMDLTIVDHDVVKIENFNRSPIFGKSNFLSNKATATAGFLKGSSIHASSYEGTWDTFVRERGSLMNSFDIWLPLANEQNVRWSMQNNVPPLMVHASTTQNWGANYGRHIPTNEDCLADRFPGDSIDDFLDCSTSEVPVEKAVIDAALPFLSIFAGALIAADLVRIGLKNYPQIPNFALVDFGGPLEGIQLLSRKSAANCLCRTTNLLQEKFNGKTRYYGRF